MTKEGITDFIGAMAGCLAVGLALALAGCSSTGTLRPIASDAAIGGTVTRGAFEPYHVEITLEGKVYQGKWSTGAPTSGQQATTAYPHKHHVSTGQPTLVAADGSHLVCTWLTHGYESEGSCVAPDQREFRMLLQ